MHSRLAIIAAVAGLATSTYVKTAGYADSSCSIPVFNQYQNSECLPSCSVILVVYVIDLACVLPREYASQ
jgi:hypothetical protein